MNTVFTLLSCGMGLLFLLGLGVSTLLLFIRSGGWKGLAQISTAALTKSNPYTVGTYVGNTNQLYTGAIFFWLVLAFTILVSGYLQIREFQEADLLKREAVPARALVIAKTITESDDSESFYITYQFATRIEDGGEEITIKEEVPEKLYATFEEGQKTEIVYARSQPRLSRLQVQYRPGTISFVPLVIGLLVALVFGAFGVWLTSQYRLANALDRDGITTAVEIIEKYETSDSESTTHYIIYALPGQSPCRYTVSYSIYKQLTVGQQVQARYLTDRPNTSRLELS